MLERNTIRSWRLTKYFRAVRACENKLSYMSLFGSARAAGETEDTHKEVTHIVKVQASKLE